MDDLFAQLNGMSLNDYYQAPDPAGEEPLEETQEGGAHWTLDTLAAIPRGIAGAAESILELPTLVPGINYDFEDNFGMGHSTSLPGSLIEGTTQFLTGFLPGSFGLGHLGKAGKAAKLLKAAKAAGRTAKGAKAAGATGRLKLMRDSQKAFEAAAKAKKLAQKGWMRRYGETMAVGGLADFAVFGEDEERLSNLLRTIPGLKDNGLLEFLAQNDEDSAALSRFKNVLEGAGLGLLVDGTLAAIKLMWRRSKIFRDPSLNVEEKMAALEAAERELQPEIEGALDGATGETTKFADNVFDLTDEQIDIIESQGLMTDTEFEDFLSGRLYDEEPGGQGHTKTSTPEVTEERTNAILKRMSLEEGFDKLDPQEASVVRELIQTLGPRMFDDASMSIVSNLDAKGRYHFLEKLIEINKQVIADGEFDETMVHELWHHVSTYLPDADRAKLEKEFLKEQQKFNNRSGTATSAEANKFKNIDEYFATTMSEMFLDDIDLKVNKLAPRGTLKRVAQEMHLMIRDLFRAIGIKLGFGRSRHIYNNFVGRQYGKAKGYDLPIKARDLPLRRLEAEELAGVRSHYEQLGYPPEEIDKLLRSGAGLTADMPRRPIYGKPADKSSKKTAIPTRPNISVPLRALKEAGSIGADESVAHMGAGRADKDIKELDKISGTAIHYDPGQADLNTADIVGALEKSARAGGSHDVVVSPYVLNTLPKDAKTLISQDLDRGMPTAADAIFQAAAQLKKGGRAYFAVRTPTKGKIGKTGKLVGEITEEGHFMGGGTYQKGYTLESITDELAPFFYDVQPVSLSKGGKRSSSDLMVEAWVDREAVEKAIGEWDKKGGPSSDMPARDLPSFKNSVPGGSKEPTVTSVFSLFSGGDTFGSALALLAQKFAGIRDSIRGVEIHTLVEWDKRALEIGNMQAGTNFSRGDVHKIDPQDLIDAVATNPYGLLFHASPVCKSFSKANRAKTIKPEDLKSAKKVAELIRRGRPPMFTLENVIDYKHDKNGKKLYKLITDALDDEGYSYKDFEVNAADFGSAQDRKRLILLATRDDMQDITTIIPELGVPDPDSKGDWHELLHDDIYNPDPASFIDETEWLSTGGKGGGVPDELVRVKKMLKSTSELQPDLPIFLMGGAGQGSAAAYNPGRPTTALTTNRQIARVLIPDKSKPQGYRAMRATPQMMRKLMGLPEGYKLPEMHEGMTLREKKAITSQSKLVLGNGIHGAITENFLFPLSMAVRKDVYEARVRAEKNLQGLFGEWRTSKSPELHSDMASGVGPYKPEGFSTYAADFIDESDLWVLEGEGEQELWHATTALSKVLSQGLRPSGEVGAKGLGESSEELISVTYSRKHAELVEDRLKIAVKAARKEISPAEAVAAMRVSAPDLTPKEVVTALRLEDDVSQILKLVEGDLDWDLIDEIVRELTDDTGRIKIVGDVKVPGRPKTFTRHWSAYDVVSQIDERVARRGEGKTGRQPVEGVGLVGKEDLLATVDPEDIGIVPVAANTRSKFTKLRNWNRSENEFQFKGEDLHVLTEGGEQLGYRDSSEWGVSSDMPRDGRLDAEEILKEYEAAVKAGDNLKKNQLIEAWGMRYGIDPDTALGIKKDGPYSDMPSSTRQPDEALGFQLRPGSKLTPYNRQVMSFLDNIIVDQSTTRGEAQGLLDILEDAAEHGDIDPEKIAGVINTATLSDQSQRMFKHLFESLGQRVNNRVDHLGNRIDPEGPDFDARRTEQASVEYLAKMQGVTPEEVSRLLRKSSALVGEQSKSASAALLYIDHHLNMVEELAVAARDGGIDLLGKLGFDNQQQAVVAFARAYDQAADLLTSYGAYRRETGRALRAFRTMSPRTMDAARAGTLVEEIGGTKRINKLIKDFIDSRKIAGKNNMTAVGRLAKYDKKRRVISMINEYFVNMILSSIRTLSTNTIGNTLTTIYGPLEVLMGARIRKVGQWVKGENLEDVNYEIDRATREFVELFHQFSGAMGWAKKAWSQKDYILDPGHGVHDMPESMKNAWTAENLGYVTGKELDPNQGWGRAVSVFGNVLRTPSRALMATDEFFKQWNYRSTVAADLTMKGRAKLEAGEIDNLDDWLEQEMTAMTRRGQALIMDNLEAEVLKRFDPKDPKYDSPEGANQLILDQERWVQEQLNSPDLMNRGEIADRALQISRERTFTTDLDHENGFLNSLGLTLQKFSYSHPWLRLFMPFIRTPVNIFVYAGRRTGLPGINKDIHRAADYLFKTRFGREFPNLENSKNEIAKGFSGSDERAKAEAMGRMSSALGFFTLFGMGAMSGTITGGGPTDKNQRKLMTAAGWQPYSVKIGDTYTSYRRLDPVATLMGIYADMYEVVQYAPPEEQDNIEKISMGIVATFFENLQNKSYIQGLTNIAAIINDPERSVSKTAGTLAAAFTVPSLVASARTVTDQNMTEVRGMLDQVISRIPLLSQTMLDPQRNVIGEPLDKKTFDGAWRRVEGVSGMIFPITINSLSNDELTQHLAELGYPISNPLRYKYGMDLTAQVNEKGQSAYDRWLEASGEVKIGGRTLRSALRRLVNSRAYQNLPEEGVGEVGIDSPRVEAIKRLINKYRAVGERKMLREFDDVRAQARAAVTAKKAIKRNVNPEQIRAKLFPMEK